MKTSIIITFILFLCMNSFSQNLDLIVTNQNDSIICRLDSVTESKISYRNVNEQDKFIYGLSTNEIKSYTYDFISETEYALKYSNNKGNQKKNVAYKHFKRKYAKRPYTYSDSDRYSMVKAGFLALIPSVGHIYTGEPQRGLAFTVGMAGSVGVMFFGAAGLAPNVIYAGAIGISAFYIWDIIDAVQVAKVKNIAIRNNDISLKVLPNVDFTTAYNQLPNNFGVKLIVNF